MYSYQTNLEKNTKDDLCIIEVRLLYLTIALGDKEVGILKELATPLIGKYLNL